ncbi:MAG: S8 family serine peptidase [Bacteroidota bacterium]|jgi:subtilisin family serine protease
MRIVKTAILLLALVTAAATAQTHHYWIVFRNKDVSFSSQKNSQPLGITERALKRRAKSLPPDRLIDAFDFPISESALSQIKQTGVKIRAVSRWLNAVSVEASPQQLQMLNALPIVSQSEPVMQFKHSHPLPSSVPLPSLVKSSGVQGLDYGPSVTQLTNMRVVDLHAIGVNGTGVLIGMLDDGFNNFRTHAALKNIKVVADSDFVHNINDVSIQPWEDLTSPGQGDHGAGTLSAVGGFDNGNMIGAAYGASFLLAKTEMDSSGGSNDFTSEEDTYVAGLEWAERLGADITSSSLGYKEFEDSLFTPLPYYTTSDMNGRTTKVARAAVIAARKGVLVVTAMGNEGNLLTEKLPPDTTLLSPADADSIISVGAASSDGELATFSSCGPTADGRIKPEVVAQGVGVYWADGSTTSSYTYESGTSCSTPLVAGAAALILSAHPDLTNMQVRHALLATATPSTFITSQNAVYPNNYYGYGFVDAFSAALSVGPVFSNKPLVTKTESFYQINIWIKQNVSVRMDSVSLYFKRISDAAFKRAEFIPAINDDEYIVTLPLSDLDSTAIGYIIARDQSGITWRAPSNASTGYFSLKPTPDSLIGIFPTPSGQLVPTQYKLYQNYPNPFNSFTFIIFEVPEPTNMELEVFNLLGQRVKHIFCGSVSTQETKRWNGTDDYGRQVASGIYFARLITPHAIRSIKMLYLK